MGHFNLIFACLFSFFVGSALSQTPLLSDPNLLQLESIFAEYKDVATERNELNLDSGPIVFLELSYAELPQTVIRAYGLDGDIFLAGYVSLHDIDPRRFVRSEEAKDQDVWVFEVDDDGDLSYSSSISSETREDIEFHCTARIDILQLLLDPHFRSDRFSFDAAPATDVEEVESQFDVAGCVDGIERANLGLSEEFLEEFHPHDYCVCLGKKLEEDPGLVKALLVPTSPEGMALIESCWEAYVPKWESLGLTFEDAFRTVNSGAFDDTAKKAFVRKCVKTMFEDPDPAMLDIGYGQADDYCECLYGAMLSRDSLSFEDLNNVESDTFIELSAECAELLGAQGPAGWNTGLRASSCIGEQHVPLVWSGGGYQVHLNVGGVTKYILLDSGASEVIISRSWFNELHASNVDLKYEGAEFHSMANGESVRVEQYQVPSLCIGDCVFRGFSIGVMEEGGMMCGMGLLGLFDTWTIDTGNSELILHN